MIRYARRAIRSGVVILALASSAVLLAWPHTYGEWAAGGTRPGGGAAVKSVRRSYGYWPYVTLSEEQGSTPSGFPPVEFRAVYAWMAGLSLLMVWATALLLVKSVAMESRNVP